MKKRNMTSGYIVLVIGAVIIISIVAWVVVKLINSDPDDFHRHMRGQGTNLYAQVQAFDENDYPDDPREIIQLFMSMRHLLYGEMIINEDIRVHTFQTMRKLYSAELYAESGDAQYAAYLEGLDRLLRDYGRLFNTSVGTIEPNRFDPDNMLIAHVTENYVGSSSPLHWSVLLVKEGDKWRIGGINPAEF
jgi:hypothetical protein